LLPHFAPTLQELKGKRDYEIRKHIIRILLLIVNAVCFFCDLCEFGSDDLFSMTSGKAAEKFVECIKTFPQDLGLIQSAGYGLGAIAKRTAKGYFSYLPQTLQII
jgi:hypothetical protein